MRWLKRGVILVLVILLGLQFVPVARTNPAVTREIKWDTPETRALAARACFDCHSNQTVWPWYSHVAPASLLLSNHVTNGRRHLNFSQWDLPNEQFDKVNDEVSDGGMPMPPYVWMHAEAKLTAAEKDRLLSGLKATFLADPPLRRERGPRPQ